jgi:hypothetical protein
VLVKEQRDRHARLGRRGQGRSEPAATRVEELAAFWDEAVATTASDAAPKAGEEAESEEPGPASLEGRPEEERRKGASEGCTISIKAQLRGKRSMAKDRWRRDDRKETGADHSERGWPHAPVAGQHVQSTIEKLEESCMPSCTADDHHGQPDVLSCWRKISAGALSKESSRHLRAGARRQRRGRMAEAV